MKRLILAGLVLLGSFGAVQLSVPEVNAQPLDCTIVLCPSCPDSTILVPTSTNCCRCQKA